MPPPPSSLPLSRVAAAFALTGLPLSVLLLLPGSSLDPERALVVVLFPVATALLGAYAWKLMVVGRDRATNRGTAAGVLANLLAYPAAWIMAFLLAEIADKVGRALFLSLFLSLLWRIQGALVFAVGTLVACGWLTIPAAGLTGYLLARNRQDAEVPGTASPAGSAPSFPVTVPKTVLLALLLTLAAAALAWLLSKPSLNPLLRWLMIAGPCVTVFVAGARARHLEAGKGLVLPRGGMLSGAASGLVVHPLVCLLFFASPDIYGMRPTDTLLDAVPFALLGWLVAIPAGALAAALVVWRDS